MKKSILSLLVCGWAIVGLAQSTIESLVADYERTKALTLAYVEAMPEDKFNFQPAEETQTFSQLFLHTCQGTIGLTSNGTGADRILAELDFENDTSLRTKSEVTRLLTETFDFAIESIKKMDENSFGEMVEKGPFNISRLSWIQKAHEHIVHHRGQAGVYLRLNGIKPPRYQLF